MQFPDTQQTQLTEKVMRVIRDQVNLDTSRYNRIFEAVYEAMEEAGADTTEDKSKMFRSIRTGGRNQGKRNLTEQAIRAREREQPTIPGRNCLCPCGSGAKYKRCCGGPVNPHAPLREDQTGLWTVIWQGRPPEPVTVQWDRRGFTYLDLGEGKQLPIKDTGSNTFWKQAPDDDGRPETKESL